MRVYISDAQLALLESSGETKELVKKFVVREPSLSLEGGGHSLADLREACGDVLMRIGFDNEYNPNACGKLLEDLIDKFFE